MTTTVQGLFAEFNKDHKAHKVAAVGMDSINAPRLATGIFPLDLAMGGGFPMGRISVIYGPESSMKTTYCLKALSTAQRLFPEKTGVFVDVEGHMDKSWGQSLGVNMDKMGYVIPPSAEKMVDMVESLMYASDLSVIVVDSLAALVTEHELDSDADKAMVGNTGILINKFYRKVTRALSDAKAKNVFPTLLCINQIRMKIGVMHGNPETQPGGPSFKFASSMTLRTYGKDEMDKEVSTALPAYKECSVVIKKWKVPIAATNSDFKIALLPNPKHGLAMGQSYDWPAIVAYLKSLGLLKQIEKPAGWELILPDTGEVLTYPTQAPIKEQMRADPAFGDRVRKAICDRILTNDNLIAPPA